MKLYLKALSVLAALLPSSGMLLAKVNPDSAGDRAPNLFGKTQKLTSMSGGAATLQTLRQKADLTKLKNAVFTLDEAGEVQVLGTKEELERLIQENDELRTLEALSSVTAPTSRN